MHRIVTSAATLIAMCFEAFAVLGAQPSPAPSAYAFADARIWNIGDLSSAPGDLICGSPVTGTNAATATLSECNSTDSRAYPALVSAYGRVTSTGYSGYARTGLISRDVSYGSFNIHPGVRLRTIGDGQYQTYFTPTLLGDGVLDHIDVSVYFDGKNTYSQGPCYYDASFVLQDCDTYYGDRKFAYGAVTAQTSYGIASVRARYDSLLVSPTASFRGTFTRAKSELLRLGKSFVNGIATLSVPVHVGEQQFLGLTYEAYTYIANVGLSRYARFWICRS